MQEFFEKLQRIQETGETRCNQRGAVIVRVQAVGAEALLLDRQIRADPGAMVEIQHGQRIKFRDLANRVRINRERQTGIPGGDIAV